MIRSPQEAYRVEPEGCIGSGFWFELRGATFRGGRVGRSLSARIWFHRMPAPRAHPHLISAAALLAANRLLLRLGLRTPRDGWRRAAGLVLRDEPGCFMLSAFGLDAWSDARPSLLPHAYATQRHVAERLADFLRSRKDMHVRIRRGEDEDIAERTGEAQYTLVFEASKEGAERFVAPTAWEEHKSPGAGDTSPLLNIVCRVRPDAAIDLWARINHVGADGVPIQDILTRLEEEWGTRGDFQYPTHEEFDGFSSPRPLGGQGALAQVHTFIDFGRLLRWRREINATLAEPMTLSAAVLWALSRHPLFRDLTMGTTVDVAPTRACGRGVGVVVVRPADFAGRPGGIAAYVREFNESLRRTRERTSKACKTLDAAAGIPARHAARLIRHALENVPSAFGTLGLTMLKDARVFGAPLATGGHRHGFIAIGSVALASRECTTMGSVTVKGPSETIAKYPAAIREAVSSLGS